jgi:hypothetical protein
MNANTDIDLDTLHAAITADIAARFPDLQTVEFYRSDEQEDRKTLPTPACVLDLSEMEASPDDDPETEQLAVVAHFEASLVLRFNTPNAKRSVRRLAAAFAAWIHKRRWNDPANPAKKLPTGPCVVVGAYKDDFSGLTAGQRDMPLDQFEIWKVEWRQIVHLGQGVWNDEGETPTDVFVRDGVNSQSDGDYEQVAP